MSTEPVLTPREKVDEMTQQAVEAASADLRTALEAIKTGPQTPQAWLDALALHFGPGALEQLRLKPDGDAAERLVVDAYRRFQALAASPPGRGKFSGRYRADPDFNRDRFLDQFGEYLIGHPIRSANDRDSAERKLTRWCKKYSGGH